MTTTDQLKYIDITPDPHILLALGAQNMPWWKALAELIDNSFDANATRVAIRLIGRTVVVADDGHGIPDIATAVTIGGHVKHGNWHHVGMYGIGLKDAWRSIGDRIEVSTIRGGFHKRLDYSVGAIEVHDGLWKLPEPSVEESPAPSGTRITLHMKHGKNKPTADCWETLSWAFYPALTKGKQIVHGAQSKQSVIAPCAFPPLLESITDTFNVAGKAVSVRIGIMAPDQRIFRGPFWIQYGHRNIIPTSLGICEFSESQMAGIITLGDGWKLTKNKDDFEDHKEELEREIHGRILPLLQKAAQLNQDIESASLKTEISGILNSVIAENKRQKRNPPSEETGTVQPRNTNRKTRKASKIDCKAGGEVSGSCERSRRGIHFDWTFSEGGSIGDYDHHGNRLRLNALHPYVSILKAERNSAALTAVCAAVLADHHCHSDSKDRVSRLMFESHDFRTVFGDLTETMKVRM